MSDALARFRERLRQNREAARQTATDAAADRPTTAARMNAPLAAGTTVFDTVTGLEGEVVGGTRENVVVPARRG